MATAHTELTEMSTSDRATLAQLRCAVVGHGREFDGPFGRKTMVYADWTASGRALAPVEDYLRREAGALHCE